MGYLNKRRIFIAVFLLSVLSINRVAAKEIIYLIDKSASMNTLCPNHRTRYEVVKNFVIAKIREQLAAQDSINIVFFDHHPHPRIKIFTIEQAKRCFQHFYPSGSTNIWDSVIQVLEEIIKPTKHKHIILIFLTDGKHEPLYSQHVRYSANDFVKRYKKYLVQENKNFKNLALWYYQWENTEIDPDMLRALRQIEDDKFIHVRQRTFFPNRLKIKVETRPQVLQVTKTSRSYLQVPFTLKFSGWDQWQAPRKELVLKLNCAAISENLISLPKQYQKLKLYPYQTNHSIKHLYFILKNFRSLEENRYYPIDFTLQWNNAQEFPKGYRIELSTTSCKLEILPEPILELTPVSFRHLRLEVVQSAVSSDVGTNVSHNIIRCFTLNWNRSAIGKYLRVFSDYPADFIKVVLHDAENDRYLKFGEPYRLSENLSREFKLEIDFLQMPPNEKTIHGYLEFRLSEGKFPKIEFDIQLLQGKLKIECRPCKPSTILPNTWIPISTMSMQLNPAAYGKRIKIITNTQPGVELDIRSTDRKSKLNQACRLPNLPELEWLVFLKYDPDQIPLHHIKSTENYFEVNAVQPLHLHVPQKQFYPLPKKLKVPQIRIGLRLTRKSFTLHPGKNTIRIRGKENFVCQLDENLIALQSLGYLSLNTVMDTSLQGLVSNIAVTFANKKTQISLQQFRQTPELCIHYELHNRPIWSKLVLPLYIHWQASAFEIVQQKQKRLQVPKALLNKFSKLLNNGEVPKQIQLKFKPYLPMTTFSQVKIIDQNRSWRITDPSSASSVYYDFTRHSAGELSVIYYGDVIGLTIPPVSKSAVFWILVFVLGIGLCIMIINMGGDESPNYSAAVTDWSASTMADDLWLNDDLLLNDDELEDF